MYEQKGQILEDFTLGQYNESIRSTLQSTVKDFINGKIVFEDVLSLTEKVAGTTEPIKRLKRILDACSKSASSTAKIPQPGKKTRPWTTNEDNRLLAGIFKFGMDNWALISKFVGNGRTRPQCSQRWYRALDPKISKEVWTEEEDQKLLSLIREYGDKKWTQIALIMGNRTDVQCRYRNKQLQRKTIGSTISDRQSGSFLFMNQQKTGQQVTPQTPPSETLSESSSVSDSDVDNIKGSDQDHTSNHIEAPFFFARDSMFYADSIDSIFNFEDDEMLFPMF